MLDRLLPGRLRILWVLLVAFVAFNACVRLGLAVFNGEAGPLMPWRLVPALAIGTAFDVGAATFFLAPLGLLLLVWPGGGGRLLRIVFLAALLPLVTLLVFVGFAEFTFWLEFASRFNFIAVDYLIYTNEMVGNLRESYNMPALLACVGIVALAIWLGVARLLEPWWSGALGPRRRLATAFTLLALPVVVPLVLDERFKEFSSDAQANEIAGNGYFDFWHAFWTNEIDYDRFYRTLPRSKAALELALELTSRRLPVTVTQWPFEREIVATGAPKRLNVVMVSVESFSAEFMTAFGNRRNLTPNMDRLAAEGLLFTRLYATGTRTVRGLEALTLSVPPTPGHSIVKRPDNSNLYTVGEIFREKGYEPLYLYGGYGHFDNMNAFYSGNGYTVVDRTALSGDEIRFENIWGVADEDLFSLTLRELDKRHAAARPLLRACDDHLEPSAVHLSGRANRHPEPQRPRRGSEVHRLRDRALHRAGARAAVLALLRPRHPAGRPGPRARVDGQLPDGGLLRARARGRAEAQLARAGRGCRDRARGPNDELSRQLIDEAISYYQLASDAYRRGGLRIPAKP